MSSHSQYVKSLTTHLNRWILRKSRPLCPDWAKAAVILMHLNLDAAAMRHDRVIIAAFSTAPPERLPNGRTRIATIHVQIAGETEPTYVAELTVAATAEGKALAADVVLQTGADQ